MKILFYGESALNPTGFGNVNKHLLRACASVADEVVHVATTHYHESYDRKEFPWTIIGCPSVPVEERTMEHQRNLETIEQYVKGLDWDVFFYQGDMGWNNDVLSWVKEVQKEHSEKESIFYMPIDGDISLPDAFHVFGWCTVPVVYTHHAKSVVTRYLPDMAEHMSVMWLGCETEVFYPLSPEEKRAARVKFFGEQYLDRFLVLNCNRNQMRKDLMRSMAAFHLFHEQHPDSTLLLHSVQVDIGGSLPFQAMLAGCDIRKSPAEIAFSNLDLACPWSREELNELYNAVDVLISTSYGEGWGLTTTEAMAAGTPVVVPANTANLDILGEQGERWDYDYERGWGVRVGTDLDHTQFIYMNGNSVAHFIETQSFLDAMEHVYSRRHQALYKADVARKWAEENTWERREKEWAQLLQMIKQNLEQKLTTTSIS